MDAARYNVEISCDFLLPPTDIERGVFDRKKAEERLVEYFGIMLSVYAPEMAEIDTLRVSVRPRPEPGDKCPRCGGKGTEMSADSFDTDVYRCWDCRGTGAKSEVNE